MWAHSPVEKAPPVERESAVVIRTGTLRQGSDTIQDLVRLALARVRPDDPLRDHATNLMRDGLIACWGGEYAKAHAIAGELMTQVVPRLISGRDGVANFTVELANMAFRGVARKEP